MKIEPTYTTEFPGDGWLQNASRAECRDRIWKLGLLTGLKGERDQFKPANFERALVLDRLVELRKPARILEIGTGRGLGSISMAASAIAHQAPVRITTLDLLPADAKQDWPLQIDGECQEMKASRDEIWSRHIDPALLEPLRQIAGPTSRTLPALAKAGEKFDLIFIDAGHDLHSVAHDLAYSAQMLAPGGAILMDDFAPMEEFGLGTCVVAQHGRRLFGSVEIFPTEGLIFGGTQHPEAPRGMVLLMEPKAARFVVSRTRLLAWRVAEIILRLCHDPRAFPARAAAENR
jgi:Methyltransferase domain